MKLKIIISVTTLFAILWPGEIRADQFLQLALWPPAQLVKEADSIAGIRLNLYGRNRDVQGVDLGFVHETTGDFAGLSLGLAGVVRGNARGVQWDWIFVRNRGSMRGWADGFVTQVGENSSGLQSGWVSLADSDFTGVQFSLGYNHVGQHLSGAQLGLVNYATDGHGLQLGLINVAENMRGLQVGLWNQINSKESWNVIPIVNWRF